MRSICYALALTALALTVSDCTTTFATSDGNIAPGYKANFSERLGRTLSFNDLQTQDEKDKTVSFHADICKVAPVVGGDTPKKDEPSATLNLSVDQKSILHVALTGNQAVDISYDPKLSPQQALKINTTVNQITITTSTVATTGNAGNAGGADGTPAKNTDDVSNCAKQVISAAVNICVRRLNSRSILSRLENIGLDQVATTSALTAGIAALSRASASDTAKATAGAAAATALATNLQKTSTDPGKLSLKDMIDAGTEYAKLYGNDPEKIPGDIAGNPFYTKNNVIDRLFDATFSACPVVG